MRPTGFLRSEKLVGLVVVALMVVTPILAVGAVLLSRAWVTSSVVDCGLLIGSFAMLIGSIVIEVRGGASSGPFWILRRLLTGAAVTMFVYAFTHNLGAALAGVLVSVSVHGLDRFRNHRSGATPP